MLKINARRTQAINRAGAAYRGINPLLYPGWDSLVDAHPGSSFIHRAAWERVIHETYGHLPVNLCRSEDGALEHGRRRNWESLECRRNNPEWQGASPSLAFSGHVLDLKHDQAALFKSF